jgi:hypothetical protein
MYRIVDRVDKDRCNILVVDAKSIYRWDCDLMTMFSGYAINSKM